MPAWNRLKHSLAPAKKGLLVFRFALIQWVNKQRFGLGTKNTENVKIHVTELTRGILFITQRYGQKN